MGSLAFIDAVVTVNSSDLSEYVTSVELPIEFEELEDTAMGDQARSRIKGLQDSSISLNWNQDFADGALDETLWAIFGTVVEVKVKATSSAVSASNPEYVGSYLISKHQPFGNSVGELATSEIEWPLSDPSGIARNTS